MRLGTGPKKLATAAFKAEKNTKNTRRFIEIQEGTNPVILGSLYIPKATLDALGWDATKNIVVSVEIE